MTVSRIMTKSSPAAAILIAATVFFAISASAAPKQEEAGAGISRPKVTFKLTFDGGRADAAIARKNPKAKINPPKEAPGAKPKFEKSLFGCGDAFVIGETGLALEYDMKGNARNTRGSFTCWVKRIDPRPEETGYRFDYFYWVGQDGYSCNLYQPSWYGVVTLMYLHGGTYAGSQLRLISNADDGEWHMITYTWSGKKVRAYFDGRLEGKNDDYGVAGFNSLVIGGGPVGTKRLIDEITFYDDVLTHSEIKQLYRKAVGMDESPKITIPPRRNDITIDGKINKDEWEGAVRTAGFVNNASGLAARTQTHARLCYDSAALYIAFSSEYPQKVKDDYAMTVGMTGALQQTREKFDTDVDSDDSFEINIEPDGYKRYYRLVFNNLGTHYDFEVKRPDKDIDEGPQIILNWNPEWQTATLLNDEGWHAEVRIPHSALEMDAPKAGDMWGLRLVRNWKILQSAQDVWGFTHRNASTFNSRLLPVEFGSEETPVVALKSWGKVGDGLVDLDAVIRNPSPKEKKLKIEVVSDSDDLKEVRTVALGAGKTHPIQVKRKLTAPDTSQVMMKVTDLDDNKVVFRSPVLLEIPQELEIRTVHYPSIGLYKVKLDAGRLRDVPLSELSISVKLVDDSGKPATDEAVVNPLPSYQAEVNVDVKKIKPGKYRAECILKHKENVVIKRQLIYEKQPLPEWYGNKLGETSAVPKPFIPITRTGDTLGCWRRKYKYGKGLFPEQITTQGSEILAGPISLVLTRSAGESISNVEGDVKFDWKSSSDTRLEYERSAALGGIPIETEAWMEFDGFIWTHMKVGPAKKGIKKLVLQIPLKKYWSQYINISDYSTKKDGFLPEQGWEGAELAVWLGNGYGGLQWVVETYAPCKVAKGMQPLRVIAGEDFNTLECTIIGVPAILDKPLDFGFGLVATPTRPQTPQRRRWLTRTADWLHPHVAWMPPGIPAGLMDWEKHWKKFVHTGKRRDGTSAPVSYGPHVQVSLIYNETPEFRYWAYEWSPNPDGATFAGRVEPVSPGSASWRDFFVWRYNKVYKYARMPGLYYDCEMTPTDYNFHHGGGYWIDGKFVAAPTILGTREITRRMYCMLRELEPEQTFIGLHASGFLNLAYMSFSDWYIDGENFTSQLNKKVQDYHKIYRVDSFLAKSMGKNTGLTVRILDEQNRAGATDEEDWKRLGPQPTLHFYALTLIHDSLPWQAYGNPLAYEMVEDALYKYNCDERYKVLAYYFDQKIVELPKDVYATFFRDDSSGRVLIFMLNNNEKDLNLQLALDWKALGFDDWKKVKVDDAVFHENEKVKIEDGKLVTPIGFVNMRMIVLEE